MEATENKQSEPTKCEQFVTLARAARESAKMAMGDPGAMNMAAKDQQALGAWFILNHYQLADEVAAMMEAGRASSDFKVQSSERHQKNTRNGGSDL